MIADTERSKMLTKRRTPMSKKTTFAGEDTWVLGIGSTIRSFEKMVD
jgi:hypothetical protein